MTPFETSTPTDHTSRPLSVWLLFERIAWTLGLACVAIAAGAYLAGIVGGRQDVKRFDALRAAPARPSIQLSEATIAAPDVSLWGNGRVRAWRAALTQPGPQPLAILRIPKLRLEVAVLPGTDEFVLNRGAGHIDDTALPGTDGNAGIAGHRDGVFRALKDIALGDPIELDTVDAREMYRVERTWIVDPDDVSVLEPTAIRSLTLVTCYPFYFVGDAPQRFIVRAVQIMREARNESGVPFATR